MIACSLNHSPLGWSSNMMTVMLPVLQVSCGTSPSWSRGGCLRCWWRSTSGTQKRPPPSPTSSSPCWSLTRRGVPLPASVYSTRGSSHSGRLASPPCMPCCLSVSAPLQHPLYTKPARRPVWHTGTHMRLPPDTHSWWETLRRLPDIQELCLNCENQCVYLLPSHCRQQCAVLILPSSYVNVYIVHH